MNGDNSVRRLTHNICFGTETGRTGLCQDFKTGFVPVLWSSSSGPLRMLLPTQYHFTSVTGNSPTCKSYNSDLVTWLRPGLTNRVVPN